MALKAMVMAAGVGSRLDPLTKNLPKPLVPVANRPVMDILFEMLSEFGVKSVIANTYYLADKIIERYCNNDFDINFEYIKEDTLSGTAGGVKKCQYFFDKGDDFLVLSADGLSNANLKAAVESHKKSGAIASIGIKKVPDEDVSKFGVIVTDEVGSVVEFQEKPSTKDAKSNYINTGIYVFNYKIFDYIPENTFFDFAKNVFPILLKENIKINTFPVNEYWSDIGSLKQYVESSGDLFKGLYNIKHSPILTTKTGKYISETSINPQDVAIVGFNTIGSNCKIGHNVCFENCIIWDNVQIDDNITLKNCIITSGNKITCNADDKILSC